MADVIQLWANKADAVKRKKMFPSIKGPILKMLCTSGTRFVIKLKKYGDSLMLYVFIISFSFYFNQKYNKI